MRTDSTILLAVALLSSLSASEFAGAQPAPSPPASCEPQGDLEYLCGPRNAEDILRLGDTDWLILSGMSGGEGTIDGHLYLVDRKTRALREWFPGANPRFAQDRELFKDCPSPLDVTNFSAHGLALQKRGADRYRLYMTSHDGREAIEAFDVSTTSATPSITWIGCVVLPANMYSNSVAILADGGFVTTQMMDRNDPEGFRGVLSGKITGGVFEWHPGGALKLVPGTELSGANGIALAADESYMYVAAIGIGELVRFDRRTSPLTKRTVTLPIRPDNVRWGDDGLLYTAGGDRTPAEPCSTPPCRESWSVVSVDPLSLTAKRVTGVPAGVALTGASVGLPVGDEIWVGTYLGDRVGILPLP